MNKLYPPQIENTLPAFYGNTIEVPYSMNRAISENDFTVMSLVIKSITQNNILIEATTENCKNSKAIFNIDSTKLQIGQFYKIQLAYGSGTDIGYFSSIGIAKCAAAPAEPIVRCENGTLCIGEYTVPSDDQFEKIYMYQFDVYDLNDNLLMSSGEQLHNSETDNGLNQYDTWQMPLSVTESIKIKYSIRTLNNLYIFNSIEYTKADQGSLVDHDLRALFSTQMDNNRGIAKISLQTRPANVWTGQGTELSHLTGAFVLSRKTNKDNQWREIARFTVDKDLPINDLWIDYTLEAGVEYTYGLQFFNNNGVYSTHIINKEGPQIADFEDAFLYDGEKQLCIKYNPKVNSFKTVKLESKLDTIGSKFPFIFRNGNVNYKEFQIGGLLSANSDLNNDFSFIDLNTIERDRSGSIQSINSYNMTELTGENFYKERTFKLNVLDWLNNGKPKLFRSPGEGNYIVRLMNVTLSPIDTLGRMIHNFNCSAYEIDDYTENNLRNYGYLAINNSQITPIEIDDTVSIMGDFNYPKLNIYYGTKQETEALIGWNHQDLNFLTSTMTPSNLVDTQTLSNDNILQIKFKAIPTYELKYKYTQFYVQVPDPDYPNIYKTEIRYRCTCLDPAVESLYYKKEPAIYHIYNQLRRGLGAGDYNPKDFEVNSLDEFIAKETQTITTFIFDDIQEIQPNIIPVNYQYQVNMKRSKSLSPNKNLIDDYPYMSREYIEDIYAIHIGNGLIAKIIYEPGVL